MKIHDKDFEVSKDLSDAVCWELAEYQSIIAISLAKCSEEEVLKVLGVVTRGERFSDTTKEWFEKYVETFHKPKWEKEV